MKSIGTNSLTCSLRRQQNKIDLGKEQFLKKNISRRLKRSRPWEATVISDNLWFSTWKISQNRIPQTGEQLVRRLATLKTHSANQLLSNKPKNSMKKKSKISSTIWEYGTTERCRRKHGWIFACTTLSIRHWKTSDFCFFPISNSILLIFLEFVKSHAA